ncbi:hypothetical protein HNO88_000455 [Novosphingobium chloroacetimidivorans]|uniref:XRE family transcriptional regulator n=1 Tax=Novosphingobium chloroacetimidivorans TaxID=1428314 RepID=A0A7W7K7R9_9SPHN|nr:hypothetical protein [Novosphingobium chloroacetimidivorans]MBB4857158.1 hypothetical protein [Novosphingobium chloroacetimidivorans]
MTSTLTPERYLKADVLQSIARSRKFLAILFAVLFALGIWLANSDDAVWVSVGTSLLASALLSLATLLIDQVRNGEQVRAADLAKAGMMEVFERRDLPEYDALVRDAEIIDVAGYTLRSFSESNQDIFLRRASEGRAVKVRILLVDPSCEAARVMEASEKTSLGYYRTNVDALLARLGSIEGIEIRYLSRHLSMMIYRIDGVLYTGPFPQHGRSRVALTMKLGKGGWLFERQAEEFDSLWAEASIQLSAA